MPTTRLIPWAGVVATSLMLVGAGCAPTRPAPAAPGSGSAPTANGGFEEPAIMVKDQAIGSGVVQIDGAKTPSVAWVVIHQAQGGAPGTIIASQLIGRGENQSFTITVPQDRLTPELIAMLHQDRGEANLFEYPGADEPMPDASGKPVMVKFKVTNLLPSAPPAKTAPPSSKAEPSPLPTAPTAAAVAPPKPATQNPPPQNQNNAGSQNNAAPIVKKLQLIAKQWEFTPSTLTVQKGDRVEISIKSADVTHGFSLPQFNVNSTLTAGQTTVVQFTADQSGTFDFRCSVFCGDGHTGMKGTLIVKE